MSRHDPGIHLIGLVDYSREAVLLAQGKSRDDLEHDRLLNLAFMRLREIVGGAANKIPTAMQL